MESVFDDIKRAIGATASPVIALTHPRDQGILPIHLIDGITKPLAIPMQNLGVSGKQPNHIPSDTPKKNVASRDVRIGSHIVGGMIAKLLVGLRDSPLLPIGQPSPHVKQSSHAPPDPTHHWAVMVGDYFHELSGDTSFRIVYNNDRVDSQTGAGAWNEPFHVGTTTYNDEAIRIAAEEVIEKMDPQYNVYNNNCQLFCRNLADIICQGGHEKPIASWEMIPALESEPAKKVEQHIGGPLKTVQI